MSRGSASSQKITPSAPTNSVVPSRSISVFITRASDIRVPSSVDNIVRPAPSRSCGWRLAPHQQAAIPAPSGPVTKTYCPLCPRDVRSALARSVYYRRSEPPQCNQQRPTFVCSDFGQLQDRITHNLAYGILKLDLIAVPVIQSRPDVATFSSRASSMNISKCSAV